MAKELRFPRPKDAPPLREGDKFVYKHRAVGLSVSPLPLYRVRRLTDTEIVAEVVDG